MDELSAKVSNCKLPWCISANERAKGNPSPVPGLSVAPSFTRKKGSNIFSFNSAGIGVPSLIKSIVNVS